MSFRRSLLLAGLGVSLTACVNQIQPIAPLNYDHIAPLYVSAGQVEIVDNYHPTQDSDRAASAFATRPDDALSHYARNRLKAQGYEGKLNFNIDDATVKHSVVQPDNSVMKWASVGVQDRYDISIRVSLTRTEGDGRQSGDAAIQVDRFITVPQSYSIAKRQDTLRDFTSRVIEQVDGMVTSSLQDRMHMTVSAEGDNAAMHSDNDGTVQSGPQAGPTVQSLPVPAVKPEALPPPW